MAGVVAERIEIPSVIVIVVVGLIVVLVIIIIILVFILVYFLVVDFHFLEAGDHLRVSQDGECEDAGKQRQDARSHGWSREPVVEILIPSTLDDTLCPPGQHVASLFCQHVAPELPDGRSWDDHREEVADLMVATVDKYAPGFAASVVGRQILTPLDLERQFGLLGGDIFHGALTLNQLFSARPMLGHADYRGPLKGLYHCGSGAHPGGGVTGAPGHNAARVILGDHRALFG